MVVMTMNFILYCLQAPIAPARRGIRFNRLVLSPFVAEEVSPPASSAKYRTSPRPPFKSWVQRIVIHGHRRSFGFGGYPLVGFGETRRMAFGNRALARQGGDLLALRVRRDIPDFAAAAAKVIDVQAGAWKDEGKVAPAVGVVAGRLRLPPPRRQARGHDHQRRRDGGGAADLVVEAGDGIDGAAADQRGDEVVRRAGPLQRRPARRGGAPSAPRKL